MADLKISQFVDGGAIDPGDEIATNRDGVNTKVYAGSAAAADLGAGAGDVPTNGDLGDAAYLDTGIAIGNVVILGDVGGNAGLPAVDGSLLTNLGASAAVTVANEASDTTSFLMFGTAATGNLGVKSNASVTLNAATAQAGFGSVSVTGSTVAGNSMYLPATNTLGWSINGTGEMQLTASALSPITDDGLSLGTTSLGWLGLYGDTGFVINIENGNWVATHTSGILTVGTGDLRITTPGTDSASVVTVGGAQAITNKSVNGVTLTTGGSATAYLNGTGSYTTPTGSGPTLATMQATTSGTSKNFTSIPSTVKEITVMVNGVSTNGTSSIIIRIGDSGGLENTGYIGTTGQMVGTTVAMYSDTTSFLVNPSVAAVDSVTGFIKITLMDAATNTWVATGSFNRGTNCVYTYAGSKSLSATLDRLTLTTLNGTDAFDAGNVNISYI